MMNAKFPLFGVAVLLACWSVNPAQAGTTRAEKKCAAYKPDRAIKTGKSKKTEVNVDVSKAGIGVDGGIERATSEEAELQEIPVDVLRAQMKVYEQCLDWRTGAITKAEFNALRQKDAGIKTAAEIKAEKEAERNAQKAIRQQGKQRRANIRAESRAKARKWVALSSAAATLGGGYLVYHTTQTARDTQLMTKGPKDDWEDLQQLNSIGWYAAAGGLVMLKITLSASATPGFTVHGAF